MPLGHLTGEFPLDRDLTVDPSPQFHVALADSWESDTDDPDNPYYIDDDSECYFVVSPGSDFSAPANASDQTASKAALDALVNDMRQNSDLKSIVPGAASSTWMDVNDGKGRNELLQSRVGYAFSDSGEKWQSLLMARAFAATGSVEYAYFDCGGNHRRRASRREPRRDDRTLARRLGVPATRGTGLAVHGPATSQAHAFRRSGCRSAT